MTYSRFATISLPFLVSIFVFFIGIIYFRYFFIGYVHGDLNAPFVLARLIIETGEVFPSEFYYGNDLIFLRQQWYIAFFLALGFEGFEAYLLGSSLVVAVCFIVLFFAVEIVVFADKLKSALASILILFPIGAEEYDFLIGQQSHLQQTTLSIAAILFLYRFLQQRETAAIVIAAIALALVTWDSPPRGYLLVAAALTGAVLVRNTLPDRKAVTDAGLVAILAAAGGYAAYRMVGVEVIGITHHLSFVGLSPAAGRLLANWNSFVAHYLGFNDLSDLRASVAVAATFAAKFLIGAAFCVAAAAMALRVLRGILRLEGTFSAVDYLGVTAVMLIAGGVVVVTVTLIDVDVRHYLPGLVMLKAAVIVLALKHSLPVTAIAAGVLFVGSSIFPYLAAAQFREKTDERAYSNEKVVAELKRIVAENGLQQPAILHGDFWYTMPYELLAPGTVAAAPLQNSPEGLFAYRWLSRPSRYCQERTVLLSVHEDDPQLAAWADRLSLEMVGEAQGIRFYLIDGSAPADCR